MHRELRLRGRKHYDAVFKRGRVWSDELLVLRALPNQLNHNRFGFVTSRRLGNAVVRNRLRRRLREVLRSLAIQPGWDVVISGRAGAARAGYEQLNRAVTGLLARARIVQDASTSGEDGL